MECVERLNELLNSFDMCRIESFDGSRLVIIGDWDLTYHHNFEAEFLELTYIECPVDFYAQSFRLATPQERTRLNAIVSDYPEHHLFCFESDDRTFFLLAMSLTLRENLVLHYQPE